MTDDRDRVPSWLWPVAGGIVIWNVVYIFGVTVGWWEL